MDKRLSEGFDRHQKLETQALAMAEYQCFYSDGKILSCDSCCEQDCCTGGSKAEIIGAALGGTFAVILIIAICCACVKRRRIDSTRHIRVHQTPTVLVVTRTIQTPDVTSDIPGKGVTGRPVYNPNVPQTGPYSYEQPTTFATFPSSYIPRTGTLAAEAPPPYSPQK
ncbi:hypothetical protein CHS0354_027840 [Potamilus streckersoni]|uniref:Uncharacterized protein n=1 Tax=Potamilus streckersoni TaxID=2493646 RepID=A0AAE0T131_9BIVA|nr:hypothetical protein CHS0354_027840 [Potamilus streckersoni]